MSSEEQNEIARLQAKILSLTKQLESENRSEWTSFDNSPTDWSEFDQSPTDWSQQPLIQSTTPVTPPHTTTGAHAAGSAAAVVKKNESSISLCCSCS